MDPTANLNGLFVRASNNRRKSGSSTGTSTVSVQPASGNDSGAWLAGPKRLSTVRNDRPPVRLMTCVGRRAALGFQASLNARIDSGLRTTGAG